MTVHTHSLTKQNKFFWPFRTWRVYDREPFSFLKNEIGSMEFGNFCLAPRGYGIITTDFAKSSFRAKT